MSFLKKINEFTYQISLFVKPGSNRQYIRQDENHLIVSLKSQPVKNKANKELMSLLKKKINIPNIDISILTGISKKEKVIQISFNEKIIGQQSILDRLFKP